MARTSAVGLLITGNAKGAVKAVNLTEKELAKLGKTVGRQSSATSKASKAIVGGFNTIAKAAATWGSVAAATAATVGVAMVKNGLETVDTLAKTSDKLGVATESLAKFRFAAEQTGVGTKTADIALQRFTRRLADASANTGPAVKAFEALGLSAQELVKLSPDEAFAKVADQMNRVENSSQKVSLAFKLFDSEGVSLLNTLSLGSEGLSAMAEEAEVLGLTLSRIDAKKVEEANDAWNKVRRAFTGLSQQLAIKFAPLLTAIADRMFGIAKEAGGMGEVATSAFNSIIKSVGGVADFIRGLHAVILGVKTVFIGLFETVLRGIDAAIDGWTKLVNLLPGPDYEYRDSALGQYVAEFAGATEDAFNELHDLAMQPMPSDSIKEFSMEVERQYSGQAIAAIEANEVMQEAAVETAQVTQAAVTQTTQHVETVWDKALEGTVNRIDSAFADAWKGAFDSFSDFADSLKDGFKQLIAELAHLLISRPLIMNIGAAFGLGGASSAASAATGGAGGLSGLASFASTGFGGLGSAYQSAGMFLRDIGLEGLGNKSFNLGLDYANQGLGANLQQFGLNLGAGVLGGFAGNAVFGNTTGIGATIGGLGGSLFGPIGTGIGSFLGSGAEKVLGDALGFGGKGGNQAGAAEFNLLTGSTNAYGIGNSFDQANVDAASGIAGALQQFAAILGGSDFSGRIKVGNRSGIKLDGTKYSSPEELFQAVFDDIVAGANNLDATLKNLIRGFEGTSEEVMEFSQAVISMNDAAGINTVTQAIKDFNTETPLMYRAIEKSNNALHNMIATFDGSAGAASQLNQALVANKAAAYEMALAIQSIGASISQSAQDQARDIRESVMSEDELRASRRTERDELRRQLQSAVDPEIIAQTTERILELNRLIFDSLGPVAQENRAEMFATQAENIAELAERRLDVSLQNLQASQEDINQKINALLQENAAAQQQAANTQLSAAQIMLQAARTFGAAPEVNI